jgi:hypothetical protein
MTVTRIFSFGYYGWGNHTSQLVQLVDGVEQQRGFKPPVFVDIRIRRSVRAQGFNGPAFERLLGPERHRWMRSLGNLHILSRTGPPIQIAEPTAANDLLDLALELHRRRRRVLFFCGCQWPRLDGEIHCHRCTVALLIRDAAERRGQPVEIVEWPGGEPIALALDVAPQQLRAARSRTSIPVGPAPDLGHLGGIPWASRVELRADDLALVRLVGPASRQGGAWSLPILGSLDDSPTWQSQSAALRRVFGLEPVTTSVTSGQSNTYETAGER